MSWARVDMILTIDFETYYDSEFSLKKLSILEYIRGPKFKVHGAAIKVDDRPAKWVTGRELPEAFAAIDWPSTTVVSHNSLFDLTVLHEKYGISPGRRIDTLGLCRALLPRDLDFDLGTIAPLLGVGEKGKELVLSKGLEELPPDVEEKIAGYACNDAELAYGIYALLWPEMPDTYEKDVLDLVLRMSTEGTLRYDLEVSARARQEVLDDRQEKLAKLPGVTPEMLRSRDRFAQLLRERGVEPPTKISPTTGKETYAFSKQDPDFVALRADPRVADLVRAREAWASNNAISRIERLERITSRPPHTLPVMLNFNGAHCVPGEVEVLTKDHGWVPLKEWEGGVIAQCTQDGKIIWEQAERYEGPIIDTWVSCSSRYINAEFTLGHRVPYYKHRSGAWSELSASDAIERGSLSLPVAGVLEGDTGELAPEAMRVLVMVQADGSYETDTKRGRRLTIFVKKDRKKRRARELLSAAHIPFDEQQYPSHAGYSRFVIKWSDLPSWLRPDRKRFGPWLLDSSYEARKAFLDELVLWDGWKQTAPGASRSSLYYCTTDKNNAEWVATISHLCGVGVSLRVKAPGDRVRKPLYIINFSLRSSDRRLVKKGHWSIIRKPQRAFCTKTKTGYWLARSNGTIFITGNTGRFSGGGQINMQNLNARGVGATLRKAIVAPPGCVIVVRDLSGIELRMNMWFSGQHDVLEFIRNGGDPYIREAAAQFGVPYESIDKNDPEGKKMRQVGKVVQLGCGYQMSWRKFKDYAAAGPLGMDPMYFTDAEAYQRVSTYRANHPAVTGSWYWLNDVAIPSMMDRSCRLERGPVVIEHESILLPNGLRLQYPGLRPTEDGWTWGLNGRTHNIYGGIVQENIVQALAGCVIKEQMVRIDAELGGERFHRALTLDALDRAIDAKGSVVHQVHDEILVICRERDADDVLALMGEEMCRPIEWCPELPLESDGGYSYCYEK